MKINGTARQRAGTKLQRYFHLEGELLQPSARPPVGSPVAASICGNNMLPAQCERPGAARCYCHRVRQRQVDVIVARGVKKRFKPSLGYFCLRPKTESKTTGSGGSRCGNPPPALVFSLERRRGSVCVRVRAPLENPVAKRSHSAPVSDYLSTSR